MDKVIVNKAYKPTASRVNLNSVGSALIYSREFKSGEMHPSSPYSGPIPTYPSTAAVDRLDWDDVEYVGSLGTTETRRVYFHSMAGSSISLSDLGLASYTKPSGTGFLFYDPYVDGYMPCYITVVQTPSGESQYAYKAYWRDYNSNIVSDISYADEFQFVPLQAGITMMPGSYGGTSMYVNLVLYVYRRFGSSWRSIIRYDGAGDNHFLPWPYDPDDRVHFANQWNGLVSGNGQTGQITQCVGIRHDITYEENVELT